nr:serine/threonine-protein phosphatase 5 [Quercus suber]
MASYQADQLKEKGNAAFKDQDYESAEAFYTQAIQKYSKNQFIFTNRANARLKLQKWEGAVDDCLKSIEISGHRGQNHKAYYFLGESQVLLVLPLQDQEELDHVCLLCPANDPDASPQRKPS